MKLTMAKLPWVLMAFALVVGGCAAPKSQMRASVEEAAVASVISVTGEELPDRVRLNIEGSTNLAYTVFRLSEPLRLIVDLADTDVTELGTEIAVDLGNVSVVNPIQFDQDSGRIGRLEISLVELWDYETSRSNDTIVIDFLKPVTVAEGETTEPMAGESVEVQPAEAQPAEVQEVEIVELTVPGEESMTEGAMAPGAEPLPPAGFINSVLFEEADGGITIRFAADGTVADYKTMDLTGPTRLVLDVQGVAKGFAPSRIPVEMGGVSRIRVGEHYDQNKLRFVMDMEGEKFPPYSLESVGSELVLRVGEGAMAAAPAEPMAVPAPMTPKAADKPVEVAAPEPAAEAAPAPEAAPAALPAVMESGNAITDIRYRGEVSGGAVLIISDSPVEYNISQPDASHLLVDLAGVSLSRGLVRSQDTRDMDGALQSLSSYNPRGADGARVSLAFAAGTTYEVDQTAGTLTISLTSPPAAAAPKAEPMGMETAQPKPVAAPAPVTPAPRATQATTSASISMKNDEGPRYTGERITLDFQNADLLNVLRLIAEVSELNIITADGVGGKISMRMQDVPWDQALDIILTTKQLGQIREGNVVRIAPRAILEGEKLAALKAKEAEIKVEDLRLEIIPISYSKAEDLVGQLGTFLSTRGTISTDSRTNSLIVKDIEANVARVKELVQTLDIPTPQVRIEARIVIVDEAYIKNLGIEWGASATSGNTRIFGDSGGTTVPNSLVNLPASNAQTALGFSFGSVGNFDNLDLRLSALEQTNNGRIISSPSLLVIQNETASIEVNNPFPENRSSTSQTDAGNTTTTDVSFPDIKTKLEITPQVTSNQDIFMEVKVEKDSKGASASFEGNTFTGINTHKLDTKIIVKNNGTAVIGGVYTEEEAEGQSSVPFFSKVPIFGWLFKNKNTNNSRNELLIFINATIVGS